MAGPLRGHSGSSEYKLLVSPWGRTEVQREVAAEFSVRSVSKRVSIGLCFTNCEMPLSLKKKTNKNFICMCILPACTYFMPGAH